MDCCSNHHHQNAEDLQLGVHVYSYPLYDEGKAQEYISKYEQFGKDLALRCYTSNLIGAQPSLVLHGGGNTSVKSVHVTKLGEEIPVLCIKGSGYNLDTIVPIGFPKVEMNHLKKMLSLQSLPDEDMVNEFRTHMMDASSPTPSVETLLHAMIDAKFVDHTHADAIVAIADHDIESAREIFSRAFQGEPKLQNVVIVDYFMPGFDLARAARDAFSNGTNAQCLVLLKHGLFTWGETAEESYSLHILAVSLAEKYLASLNHPKLTPRPYSKPSHAFFDRAVCTMRGVMQELSVSLTGEEMDFDLSSSNPGWIVMHKESALVSAFAQSEECSTLSQIGTITPDHVIRTKAKPLIIRGLVESVFYEDADLSVETPAQDAKLRKHIRDAFLGYVDNYLSYFEENNARAGNSKIALDPLPRILLVENFGLFAIGRTFNDAKIAAEIYEHTVPVILSSVASSNTGVFEPASLPDLFDCEYWSLEQAKLKLGKSGSPKPLAGRVAWISGGCSGIGLGTAELFASQGAAVFVVDIVPERVAEAVSRLKKPSGGAVVGSIVDVCDPEHVERGFHQCVRSFGGVDIVVSNAGIVVQASPGMASCALSELEKSMKINFYAHQFVSSAGARRMITQGFGGVLLYNISKAPIFPGPKMGPYCVAKAATLALMRQYALEYSAHHIRSNGVNADRVRTNLFDLKLVEQRAAARGLTADEYFRSNLLKEEVEVEHVAKSFLDLALSLRTTAAILCVDGGAIENALR